MVYKFDFTKRNDKSCGSVLIDYVADEVEATKKFMRDFFVENPGDAVRIDSIRQVEFIGDASALQKDA